MKRCECCGASTPCEGKGTVNLESGDYVAVHRPDNEINYFKFGGDEFFRIGGGFGISKFQAKKIEKVDEVPVEWLSGSVTFDEQDTKKIKPFKALVQRHVTWNGWAMPMIHIKDVRRLCNYLNEGYDESDEYGMFFKFNGDKVEIIVHEKHEETYGPIEAEYPLHDGEAYYDFGLYGFTFQFKQKEA